MTGLGGGCGGGRSGKFGFFIAGDAEELLAVVALDEFTADVVGDGEELSAAEIGTEELYRHTSSPSSGLIGGMGWCLEESRVIVERRRVLSDYCAFSNTTRSGLGRSSILREGLDLKGV